MSGNIPKNQYTQKTFCDNLRYACKIANDYKMDILIEPLNSKENLNMISENARKISESNFSDEVNINKLIDLYKSIN